MVKIILMNLLLFRGGNSKLGIDHFVETLQKRSALNRPHWLEQLSVQGMNYKPTKQKFVFVPIENKQIIYPVIFIDIRYSPH